MMECCRPTHSLKSLFLGLLLFGGCLLPMAIPAQDGPQHGSQHGSQADPFIHGQLNRLHVDYTIDEAADFLVKVHLENERSQLVIIRSEVNTYRDAEVREIYSLARSFHKTLPESFIQKLLEDSYISRYTGSWAAAKKDDIVTLIYLAKIPAHVSDEYLLAVIMETAYACDGMEEYLGSKEDRY